MPRERKVVSLSLELGVLERAIEGARVLADHAMEQTTEEAYRVHPVISAVLSLAGARLRLVDRAIRGEVSPSVLYENFNLAAEEDDGNDVRLMESGARRQPRHARRGGTG